MSGIYTGASGMIHFENNLNTTGNNISNSQTTGFKSDKATGKVFQEAFMRKIAENTDQRIGFYQNQVHTDNVTTNFKQGVVQETGRTLDFALMDPSVEEGEMQTRHFFEVEMNGENLLTRDGQFEIDSDGFLNTTNGGFVLNEDGERINIEETVNVSVSEFGEITNADTGELIDTFQIRSVDENNLGFLEKAGQNNYRVMTIEDIENQFGPIDDIVNNFDNYAVFTNVFNHPGVFEQAQMTGEIDIFNPFSEVTIRQGAVENSNVNLAKEMTDLMLAQKGFTSNSKALTTMDMIQELEANRISN